MTPERRQQVQAICDAVIDCAPEERSARLEALCAGDDQLKRDVAAMTADATRLGARSEGSVPGWMPETIGSYRILRLVGEGGMGVVYEAQQSQPQRTVALKVIKPGLASPEILRRFRLESQALGRLQHPGIAQIYEAGTADSGFGPQSYFAMEFICGETLREHAESRHLNARARLDIVARICDGVEHAHQRGLIHRDLKPGNILVDAAGHPKILDFGVAHLTDKDAHATQQTALGQLVGTLAYMSPEQVLADPLELDTRCDVYALGVILYELLAGQLPYTISGNLHEATQTILEVDPPRLGSISRFYRGDVETIVAKALDKDKTRRYGSAAALADDIRRYLADQPVLARPTTASYQVRKFARRHKALVGALIAVFAVLMAGVAASTWQAMRANSERDRAVREKERADTEADTAKAVIDFLKNDLLVQAAPAAQSRPDVKPDPDLKVRTALDRAAARIEGKFSRQPAVEASIRQTLGETYRELGLYPEAERELTRAVEMRTRVLGAEHPDSLRSLSVLGTLYRFQGKIADAESVLTRLLDVHRRVYGDSHKETLDLTNELALLYIEQGKFAQAEPFAKAALEGGLRIEGSDSAAAASLINNLGLVYWNQGKYDKAEELYTKALDIRHRVQGEEHPETMITLNNLAVLYSSQGKYASAGQFHTRLLEVRRRVLGPEHPDVLFSMHSLADTYLREGKYSEGEALNEKLQEMQRRVLGETHPLSLLTLYQRGIFYRVRENYQQSDAIYTRVLQIRRRVMGDKHPETVRAMIGLAINAMMQGRYEEAEPRMLNCLNLWRASLGPDHPETGLALSLLGETRLRSHKYREAEPVLREALQSQEKANATVWQRFNLQSLLGESLSGQKQYAEAEPLLISGYEGMVAREDRMPAYNRVFLTRARERIVRLYQAWGKVDRAADWTAAVPKAKS